MTQPTRTCIKHPDSPAPWLCSKYSFAYCDACCRCPHPDAYCKFRPQCLIWHIAAEDAQPDSPQPPTDR